MNFIILIIVVLVLLFLAAFFSCTETAITSINKTDERKLSPEKNKTTLYLISIKDKIVASTLVGTNLVNNITTSIVTAFTIKHFSNIKNSKIISTIIVTFLIILFAEILPKSLATYKPLEIIKVNTPALQIMRYIFLPITCALNIISRVVLKFFSLFSKNKRGELTGELLQVLVDMSVEDGALSLDEQNLLTGAIHLRDLKLRNIITPVIEMDYIDSKMNVAEAVKFFCETKYSRLPVCGDDDTNSVLGVVHYKDILFTENKNVKITELMREAVFVPETAGMFKVIDIMKSERTNIIIAIDEHGQNVGVATMDDIITAVFGTIKDEYDDADEKDIVPIGATRFKIRGDAKLYDINRELDIDNALDVDLKSDFYDTIAGLILETSEILPEEGSVISIDNIDFKIEKIEERKIHTVIADTARLLKTKKEKFQIDK